MNNIEIAAVLRKLAAILDPSGQSTLPAAQAAAGQVFAGTTNAFGASEPYFAKHIPPEFAGIGPYGTRDDISSPGNQQALRSQAFRAGETDLNRWIRDRNFTPIWPNEKQWWEEF